MNQVTTKILDWNGSKFMLSDCLHNFYHITAALLLTCKTLLASVFVDVIMCESGYFHFL